MAGVPARHLPCLPVGKSMRSKLFVPGIRPELFNKAYASHADVVSIDLDDAVPAVRKREAREAVAAYLTMHADKVAARTAVRVNPWGSPELERDLAAIVPLGIALINLPRVESVGEVVVVMDMIERIEAASGLPPDARLLVNIETPKGLHHAADIALAHARVAGLQLGLGDLFEPYGICREEPSHVRMVMLQVAMAAAGAGVRAYDGAHPDYRTADRFEREAGMAHALGFMGKTCIHPNQVEWANRIFQISADEVAWARRMTAAARQAGAQGHAVFTLDGNMVDAPYLRRAERLLDQATRLTMPENRRP